MFYETCLTSNIILTTPIFEGGRLISFVEFDGSSTIWDKIINKGGTWNIELHLLNTDLPFENESILRVTYGTLI